MNRVRLNDPTLMIVLNRARLNDPTLVIVLNRAKLSDLTLVIVLNRTRLSDPTLVIVLNNMVMLSDPTPEGQAGHTAGGSGIMNKKRELVLKLQSNESVASQFVLLVLKL